MITMEYFEDATKIEDVINPKKEKFRAELPEKFDIEIFFSHLTDFIKNMHEEKNIYHRDLFSRNILIDHETGNPIVLDFGDAAYQGLDENYDAYGRRVYFDNLAEDLDFKNIRQLKESMLLFIEKKTNT